MKNDQQQSEGLTFFECTGVNIRGTLKKIEKAADPLRPLIEAVSNALDAIDAKRGTPKHPDSITIEFHYDSALRVSDRRPLSYIVVKDTGRGLTQEDFDRLSSLFDCSKGKLNKGSGRLQYVKFFGETVIESRFRNIDTNHNITCRKCILSADDNFINNNSILKFSEEYNSSEERADDLGTRVTFRNFLSSHDRDYYDSLCIDDLREELLTRFLLKFHEYGEDLPDIKIVYFGKGDTPIDRCISDRDVPTPNYTQHFKVQYKTYNNRDGKIHFKRCDKEESFLIRVFKITDNKGWKNSVCFVSRGERVRDANLKLMNANDSFGGFRYLITISGDFIDQNISDTRGTLTIKKDEDVREDFRNIQSQFFPSMEPQIITIDDICTEAENVCAKLLPELAERKRQQQCELRRLCLRFGFSKRHAQRVEQQVTLQDGKDAILKRLYKREAVEIAQRDAILDDVYSTINGLDPSSKEFEENLREKTEELFQTIPEQNIYSLSHYMARRSIILDLFGMALNRRLHSQKDEKRKSDERRLHDILFKQKEMDPRRSNLWLLDEEFVFFPGSSDKPLKDVEYNGKKIMLDITEYPEEIQKYLTSDNHDRTKLRPDILLFPEENKCVIIELKKPEADLSEALHQLNKYTSIIHEFCSPDFGFNIFYTLLIGGKINSRDLRNIDRELVEAKRFGFMYATHKLQAEGREDGTQYIEVHTYQSLLERAKIRNKMFLDHLFSHEDVDLNLPDNSVHVKAED